MNTLSVLFHLARADFLERSRRFSFILTLALIILMGVLVINGTLSVQVNSGDPNTPLLSYRGEYNSAWIGMMTVLVTNTFLGLIGFYLVSNCIKRDIETGVGQIIATTPIRRTAYLLGKWISNFLILSTLVLMLSVIAAIMVLLKKEAPLELGAILMPFFAVGLPFMGLIAAFAIIFETVPVLRGAIGNVVYFFVWLFLLIFVVSGNSLPLLKDPMGLSVFRASIIEGARTAYPDETMGPLGVGGIIGLQTKVFNWSGMTWDLATIGFQWLWVGIGLILILLSAKWFARFDPSKEGLHLVSRKPKNGKEDEPFKLWKKLDRIKLPSLSPLITKLSNRSTFLAVLFIELRILLKGRRWWWWLIIAGLNITILAVPLSLVKQYLLAITLLWPISLWSGMGNRERKNNTFQMVFSSSRPVLRQLPPAWLAGILVTGLLSIAGAIVFIMNGDLSALVGWIGAIIFIPSLALALGVISSGERVFQVIYVIWWYIGPLQKTSGLDFINGHPLVYMSLAVGLFLISTFWRSKQIRM